MQSHLDTIQVNRVGSGDDIGVFVVDISYWEPFGAGSRIHWRDTTRDYWDVAETPTQITAAIAALRQQYATIANYLQILDGVTAPGAGAGMARIYVDTSDGDLKAVFADGTVKTIVTDT